MKNFIIIKRWREMWFKTQNLRNGKIKLHYNIGTWTMLPSIYFTVTCFDTHLHRKINFDLLYPLLIDKRLNCQVVKSQHISALDSRQLRIEINWVTQFISFFEFEIASCLMWNRTLSSRSHKINIYLFSCHTPPFLPSSPHIETQNLFYFQSYSL